MHQPPVVSSKPTDPPHRYPGALLPCCVLLLLLGAGGCEGSGDGGEPAGLPVALCGMGEYTLLDPATQGLGRPIQHEQHELFGNLTSSALDVLLSTAGFGALTPVPHGAAIFRFRYTTQDRGRPVEATGLIGIPRPEPAPAEPWPVALFLHGFAGAADPCAPSADETIGPALTALIAANGFLTVAPDYIGMNGLGAASTAPHAPLVGEQVALGSWDALRAGLALLDGELADEISGTRGEPLVIWGGSQGGHAALFVELYGGYYAPEIPVSAVIATSPALDLRAIVEEGIRSAVGQDFEEHGIPAALSALALVGMRRWYGVPESMHGVLTNREPYFIADRVEEVLEPTGDECEVQADFEASAIEEIYEAGFIDAVLDGDWASLQPWTCFVEENSASRTAVRRRRDTPVLTVFGEADPLVIPQHQYAGFDAMCEAGWALDFLECEAAPHGETTLWSIPDQLAWLRLRLDKVPLSADELCQRQPPTRCLGTPEDLP